MNKDQLKSFSQRSSTKKQTFTPMSLAKANTDTKDEEEEVLMDQVDETTVVTPEDAEQLMRLGPVQIDNSLFLYSKFDRKAILESLVISAKKALRGYLMTNQVESEYAKLIPRQKLSWLDIYRADSSIIIKYMYMSGINTNKLKLWLYANGFPDLVLRYNINQFAETVSTVTLTRIMLINPTMARESSELSEDSNLRSFAEALKMNFDDFEYKSLSMAHLNSDNKDFNNFVKMFMIYKSCIVFNKNSRKKTTLLESIKKQSNVIQTYKQYHTTPFRLTSKLSKMNYPSDVDYQSVIKSATENKLDGGEASVLIKDVQDLMKKVRSGYDE